MSNSVSLSTGDLSLLCPSCGNENLFILPMTGHNGQNFLKTLCLKCKEDYFFQLDKNILSNFASHKNLIKNFQLEWEDWLYLKKKHFNKQIIKKPLLSKFSQLVLFVVFITSILFFNFDRWHLITHLFENHSLSQSYIDEYSKLLLDIHCIPSIMKKKIRTIPILYTREQPVKKNFVQFGEAGVYWGKEQIKIHRSNFWFFGFPKKTQLLNSLVHELRHRINPEIGHNKKFFDLVDKDMECVLKSFNQLKK